MSFQLAKDGKALALIVTAKGASEQEAYAATELRNYLTMISGAAFDAGRATLNEQSAKETPLTRVTRPPQTTDGASASA